MRTIALLVMLSCSSLVSGEAQERQIRVSVIVPATPEKVWPLWTTDEGVRSFFAPGSHIDLRVDGAYEIFFDPSAPLGQRGADGMRLLAVEPNRRLAFTWNAPEALPYTRAQRTMVIVEFTPVGTDSTRVTLRHVGWGTGPEWDATIQYFEPAWNGFVMPSFKRRVEQGPINWEAPPDLVPVQPTAIELLAVSRPVVPGRWWTRRLPGSFSAGGSFEVIVSGVAYPMDR